MDCSKVIAAGALYDGDPWDIYFPWSKNVYTPKKALPVTTDTNT